VDLRKHRYASASGELILGTFRRIDFQAKTNKLSLPLVRDG
jgi:hypothetical protein